MSNIRKICIVMGAHWARQMGGAQYQAKCIVEVLKEAGNWDIYYLATMVDSSYQPSGYQVISIGGSPYMKRLGSFIWDANALRGAIRTINPDIVYQRGLKAHTGILGKICTDMSIPLVFHIAHDDDVKLISNTELFRHSFNRWLNKRVGEKGLRRATATIAQTQYQSTELKQNYDISATLVNPNFHPVPDIVEQKPADSVQIIWVANFKPSKQPTLFVDLAENCSEYDKLRFVMIGRRGHDALYSSLYRRIDSLANLRYLGEQSIERVNKELSDSHIFINTSISEGFPNTFIQAWMRCVPVLSLNVDPDNVMEQQLIGRCCRSLVNLRAEMLELAQNDQVRIEMGQRAAVWAAKTYGPAASGQIMDLLLKLTEDKVPLTPTSKS